MHPWNDRSIFYPAKSRRAHVLHFVCKSDGSNKDGFRAWNWPDAQLQSEAVLSSFRQLCVLDEKEVRKMKLIKRRTKWPFFSSFDVRYQFLISTTDRQHPQLFCGFWSESVLFEFDLHADSTECRLAEEYVCQEESWLPHCAGPGRASGRMMQCCFLWKSHQYTLAFIYMHLQDLEITWKKDQVGFLPRAIQIDVSLAMFQKRSKLIELKAQSDRQKRFDRNR